MLVNKNYQYVITWESLLLFYDPSFLNGKPGTWLITSFIIYILADSIPNILLSSFFALFVIFLSSKA